MPYSLASARPEEEAERKKVANLFLAFLQAKENGSTYRKIRMWTWIRSTWILKDARQRLHILSRLGQAFLMYIFTARRSPDGTL